MVSLETVPLFPMWTDHLHRVVSYLRPPGAMQAAITGIRDIPRGSQPKARILVETSGA